MQDLAFWQGRLGVHRAPSVVFLRGPGALPAVYDTSNTKRLDVAKLVADNSWQVGVDFASYLPQHCAGLPWTDHSAHYQLPVLLLS